MLMALCVMTNCGCRLFGPELLARKAAAVSTIGQPRVSATPIRRAKTLNAFTQLVVHKPRPSERTEQLLRRYVLDKRYQTDPESVLKTLQAQTKRNPLLNDVHALAELAKIEGDWKERLGKSKEAARMHATALLSSYEFLFDNQHDLFRNAYDPQFRSISDIYNHSLESLIRALNEYDELVVGNEVEVQAIDETLRLRIAISGRWADQEFERFELVNDFEVEGLDNEYRTYGLGVPMIAVRRQQQKLTPNEKYYPPGLSLPLTAFMQLIPYENATVGGGDSGKLVHAELKLIDPLQQTMVTVNGRRAPLESDISTPMAYYLNDPLLNSNLFATLALLDADFAKDFQGLYMLEPYDPNKIPVVMFHGFWSSPTTWLQMFNDLRASKDVREHYQFWFYMYPTGQPFWVTAAQTRKDLKKARQDLDPYQNSTALDQMVLVGHSMGGLVARMQTIESGNDFWELVTDRPFSDVKGSPESIEKLKSIFFFEPNEAVQRVVTIATPHKGSFFANNTTRWLSRNVFSLPQMTRSEYDKLMQDNPEIFRQTDFSQIRTSVDSLAPGAPFIEAMNAKQIDESVTINNIFGRHVTSSIFSNVGHRSDKGDGVVSVDSATAIEAESQLEVNAEHVDVHRHPKTILDVRRILLDHLVEVGRLDPENRYVLPVGYLQSEHHDGNPDK